MAIKLPTHFMGVPVNDVTLKKVLEGKSPSQPIVQPITPIVSPKNLDGSKYIQVPGTNILIAREETHKNSNWTEAHYNLFDEGLFMPSPSLFVPYFINVRDASQGKVQLYDGNNTPLSRADTEDLWKYLSTAHRSGCWTWLDALFVPSTAGLDLQTNHRVKNSGGNKELVAQRFNLEAHVGEDGFANLNLNSQGLPKQGSKSADQRYSQGNNIYFYQPRPNCVARFDANSGRAGLYCNRTPGSRGAGLGVFGCAEGASVAKT